ncbi:MAG TPA: tRNA lysidine(34) synthetase TilS, partial [Verrucomicrobiae bacterium]|nr:tRNA lysidine(34) synthetase TilS [Verrucomicrobiae bacterium]
MTELGNEIERCIRTRKLLSDGQSILVAVSGGLDSMVLLRLLADLSAPHRWKLTVAHFNHGLRGRQSDADERLVVRTASRFGLPLRTDRGDVRAFARTRKVSLEMGARHLRHSFLALAARESGAGVIALAHHADDQLELFFLRLLRGTGSDGLRAMGWISHSPADPSVKLIRPLLGHTKAALHEFARLQKVKFREDATNASLDFQRNRIRHELLPLLRRKYQPALQAVIARIVDITS